jgi:hypothetical protein
MRGEKRSFFDLMGEVVGRENVMMQSNKKLIKEDER